MCLYAHLHVQRRQLMVLTIKNCKKKKRRRKKNNKKTVTMLSSNATVVSERSQVVEHTKNRAHTLSGTYSDLLKYV